MKKSFEIIIRPYESLRSDKFDNCYIELTNFEEFVKSFPKPKKHVMCILFAPSPLKFVCVEDNNCEKTTWNTKVTFNKNFKFSHNSDPSCKYNVEFVTWRNIVAADAQIFFKVTPKQ